MNATKQMKCKESKETRINDSNMVEELVECKYIYVWGSK